MEGVGRAGIEDDHFTFAVYDKVRGSMSPPFADTVLCLKREDYVHAHKHHRTPLDFIGVGSLAFYDEDEFSAKLLQGGCRSVSHIVIHVIKTSMGSMFDTVRCESMVETLKVKAEAPAVAPPLPPPPLPPPAGDDGEMDFLEELARGPGAVGGQGGNDVVLDADEEVDIMDGVR